MTIAPDWPSVHRHALEDLRRLIQCDTSNPPGNERPAAELLAERLQEDGIECRLLEGEPTRANLVARIEGTDPGAGPILLSAHLDVVPADPEGWTHPPFAAEIEDGVLYGRGAVDMKNMAVMSAWCMKLLARSGKKPRRTLIFAAVADEEERSTHGAAYLVREHADLVRAEYAIGEVGAFTLQIAEQPFYPIQVAEKGACRLKMTARGTPGHGSIPREDTAVIRLAEAIQSLGAGPLPRHSTWAVDNFIETIARNIGFAKGSLFRQLSGSAGGFVLGLLPKEQARGISALLSNTATPTMLKAGERLNVIPDRAEAWIDGRILPGQTENDLIREIRDVVGSGVELEAVETSPPVCFDEASDPLFRAMCATIVKYHPEAVPTPYLTPGYTDAKLWSRLGAKCFGFAPLKLDDPALVFSDLFHGRDERIPVDGFRWGLEVLWDLVSSFVE